MCAHSVFHISGGGVAVCDSARTSIPDRHPTSGSASRLLYLPRAKPSCHQTFHTLVQNKEQPPRIRAINLPDTSRRERRELLSAVQSSTDGCRTSRDCYKASPRPRLLRYHRPRSQDRPPATSSIYSARRQCCGASEQRAVLGTGIGGAVCADPRMKEWEKIVFLTPKVSTHRVCMHSRPFLLTRPSCREMSLSTYQTYIPE